MPKLVKVHDPSERRRRLPIIIQEEVCPGLLQFFSTLKYGTDAPLMRGVFYQWYQHHKAAGTLETAIAVALAGPGGETKRTKSHKPLDTQDLFSQPNPAAGAVASAGQQVSQIVAEQPVPPDSGTSPDPLPTSMEESPDHLSLLDSMIP